MNILQATDHWPTSEMWNAFENAAKERISFTLFEKGFLAALAVAPTPPAQEDEPVEPIGQRYQYADLRGRWYDCSYDDLECYAERGDKTRILYVYVDQPVLYTRATDDKLRKAADEVSAMIADLFGDFGDEYFQEKMRNLRAALEQK